MFAKIFAGVALVLSMTVSVASAEEPVVDLSHDVTECTLKNEGMLRSCKVYDFFDETKTSLLDFEVSFVCGIKEGLGYDECLYEAYTELFTETTAETYWAFFEKARSLMRYQFADEEHERYRRIFVETLLETGDILQGVDPAERQRRLDDMMMKTLG